MNPKIRFIRFLIESIFDKGIYDCVKYEYNIKQDIVIIKLYFRTKYVSPDVFVSSFESYIRDKMEEQSFTEGVEYIIETNVDWEAYLLR